MKKKWYSMKKTTALLHPKNKEINVGEIYIYGEIVDEKWFESDATPTDFINDLKEMGDVQRIDLYVNSYGGNVFAGMAIYNLLKRHSAEIVAHVDGIAASIASVIIQSADQILIPRSGMIMVHKPWGIAIGDADDMSKTAEVLNKLQESIETVFVDRGQVDEKKLKDFINAETWFTGEEAVEEGFADKIEEGKEIKASMKDNKIFINDQEIKTDKFKAFPQDRIQDSKNDGTADPDPAPAPSSTADPDPAPEGPDEMLEYQSISDQSELILQINS